MNRWIRRNWEELARQDALGAILTGEAGTLRAWSLDEFYASGRADVAAFFARLDALAPQTRRRRALDFGCGVGRISRALADTVPAVVGVDVAPTMIRRARGLNADRPACTFVLNRAPHLRRFAGGSFDLVYSRLVLQHLPPSIARRYIAELVRVLAPGGVLMFQIPEVIGVDPQAAFRDAPVKGAALKRALPRLIVRPYRWMKYRVIARRRPGMEMFGMPRTDVLDTVVRAGGRVLSVDDDAGHGTAQRGFAYWVTRADQDSKP